tara:strand:- start:5595 stop:6074 length:480 start_codon:yes stop_codon:yes gene_type:complete
MSELTEIVPLIDEKWETDSKKMRNDRKWLVQKACERIMEMVSSNINKEHDENNHLPNEIVFNWFDVKKDLSSYLSESKVMSYSFETIFNGGFSSKNGKIRRERLRDAGVDNPFVLDVKREIASNCIKVWDVSDKEISKKIVWKITIFVEEIRKSKKNKE